MQATVVLDRGLIHTILLQRTGNTRQKIPLINIKLKQGGVVADEVVIVSSYSVIRTWWNTTQTQTMMRCQRVVSPLAVYSMTSDIPE